MKLNKYIREAQGRAQRRKSPWNALLFVLVIMGIGVVYYSLARAVLFLPHPEGTTFRQIANGHDAPMMLIMLPLFFPSIAWGMILANLVMWGIPPARSILNREAEGHKGCSFRESVSALLKFALVATFIAVPIALIASYKISL